MIIHALMGLFSLMVAQTYLTSNVIMMDLIKLFTQMQQWTTCFHYIRIVIQFNLGFIIYNFWTVLSSISTSLVQRAVGHQVVNVLDNVYTLTMA